MLKKILFSSLLIFVPSIGFAAGLPFTDVSGSDPYYSDLTQLYNAGVITDTADHLFHPMGLLPRDEFAGTVIGVSCKKCINPSIADIIHYSTNPFVDVSKKNTYFYCISYAKEKEIVRWYVLDATGKTQCQNKETFSEVPFCPANNVSRIEAAAVLLRQAGLWDELKNNSPYNKKIILQDVDAYWYGYAQKAVETGLISIDKNGKVFPNEYIMRKEFVSMASKIFSINMCQMKNNAPEPTDFASIIKIFDKDKQNCSESQPVTTFPDATATTYDFGGFATGSLTSPLQYNWTFINTVTNEQMTATGGCLNNFDLKSAGLWTVKLIISDANGRSSTAYQQVSVGTTKNTELSVQIGTVDKNSSNPLRASASTLYGIIDVPMPFFSVPTGWDGNYSYSWNFSDGGTAVLQDPMHTFMQEGVYPVVLIVHDTSGNIAYAQLTVIITVNPDRDKDGTLNVNDVCPDVFGPASNKGCPLVGEYKGAGPVINNLCLTNKIKTWGMIEGNMQCASCPCQYASEFTAQVRGCDIIFPSITSPDKKTLYSRGSIFAVP